MKIGRPFLLLALATLAACGEAPDREAALAPGEVARAAPARVAVEAPDLRDDMRVSTAWLADRLGADDLVILHVDEDPAGYERGHLPGARFLDLARISEERDGLEGQVPSPERLAAAFAAVGVGEGDRVIVYGPPLFAARVMVALEVVGHEGGASLLDGGLPRWSSEGRPLSTEAARPEPGDLRADGPTDRIVDAAWIRERLASPEVQLIDARPPEQYSGEEPGDDVARPGHIPTAVNLFWERTVESPERPTLRDPEALREMFRQAGVEPDDTVVAYCRSGLQSSFLYFVSRYLGYETRLYDGSYVDWSRQAELPVVRGTQPGRTATAAPG